MIRKLKQLLAAVLLLLLTLTMAIPAAAATTTYGTASSGGSAAAQDTTVSSQSVYDIILFWGQSNMVGWARGTDLPYANFLSDLPILSQASGIDEDILSETTSASHADIPLEKNTVYQYNILNDSLEALNTGDLTGITGKDEEGNYSGITWDEEKGTWAGCHEALGDKPAAAASLATNMIPAFCAEYTKKTGHKVIVLFAAIGGAGVQAFLPMDQADYRDDSYSEITNYSHVWEYIKSSYEGAVSLCRRQGCTIGNSLWVSYQGESDLDNDSYMKYYNEVTENLSDLGLKKGALVETSNTIGDNLYPYVERMHVWQEALALLNSNITIGSTLDYDEYIPDSATYAQYPALQTKWSNLDYATAYQKASWYVDTLVNNRVHMNSAALSQIGRDTADNLIALVDDTTASTTAAKAQTSETADTSAAAGTTAGPVTGIQIIDYGY